ncbi:tetratricopeptide repeat protein [Enterovibrio sp. 27052020O]|uniref:tetratricopeptide repeat protein n=1 Tax=Enterovibrio sp. 27052020O TaxID=3241166 RepID=UPI003890230A
MSELNRMLSDLTSPDNNANRVAAATIPSTWGFRFARVVLALVATLVCATGIAWAVSSGDHHAAVSPEVSVPSQVLVLAPQETATPAIAAPSPTQKVSTRDRNFVHVNAVEERVRVTPTSTPTPTPVADVLEPVLVAQVQSPKADALPIKATPAKAAVIPKLVAEPTVLEVAPESSLSVETIALSGEQLADIAYDKAQKRAQVGDTQKAIAYLRDAVKYDANHIAATNQLAGLLYGRNKLRDAESVLRKGISTNPSSASLKLTLARMYQQSQREESALNVLMAPVDGLDGEHVRYVSLRAALAQKLAKHDVAKQSYQWLAEREPADGRWWLGLAISAEREKDDDDAKRGYAKAITAGGLSNESVQFARQRLAYLNSQLAKGAENDR